MMNINKVNLVLSPAFTMFPTEPVCQYEELLTLPMCSNSRTLAVPGKLHDKVLV